MSNVLTTTSVAFVSSLNVVTTAATALDDTAASLGAYAKRFRLHAERENLTAIKMGKVHDAQSMTNKIAQKALDDVLFEEGIAKQLSGNAARQARYDAILMEYQTLLSSND
jgi:hypothetical protein